jgi:tetratricopeptide (TPR) repeat protein
MMMVHFLAGEVAAQEGRQDDAKENYQRSLAIEDRLHHPQHRARILISLGGLLAAHGEYGEALDCHGQALELALEVGDQHRAASAQLELGTVLRMSGGLDQAKARLIEAVRTALKLRARLLLLRCLLELARVENGLGNDERAARRSSILAGTELGPLQRAYEEFAQEAPLPAGAMRAGSAEAAAFGIVEEAELTQLLL